MTTDLMTALMKAGSLASACTPRSDPRQVVEMLITADGIKARGTFNEGDIKLVCNYVVNWKTLHADPDIATTSVLMVGQLLATQIKAAGLRPLVTLGGTRA